MTTAIAPETTTLTPAAPALTLDTTAPAAGKAAPKGRKAATVAALRAGVTREKLQEGLAAVGPAVPAKTTLAVLNGVLLTATPEGLRLTAGDYDLVISRLIPADVTGAGAAVLPAKKVTELARELPPGTVQFTAQGADATRVEIEAGTSKFKLLGTAASEYPNLLAAMDAGEWKVRAGDLAALVAHTAYCASTEESRPILNGVKWEARPGKMRLVATNGHRLARAEKAVERPEGADDAALTADLIVPPKGLEQIKRLFAADDVLTVRRSAGYLAFSTATTTVQVRLIEGPYPPYEGILPKNNDKIVVADRAALIAMVKRVDTLASDQTHRIKLTVTQGAEGAVLTASVQTPDLGEASDELSVRWKGDLPEGGFAIGFNANYLGEILRNIPTDLVRLTFLAAEHAATVEPVTVRGAENAPSVDVAALLMPLRITDA